jgi:hypothetical protein
MQVLDGKGSSAKSLETEQILVEQSVFMLFPAIRLRLVKFSFHGMKSENEPPLDIHNALEQSHNLFHAAHSNKLLSPSDRFIAQKQPQLV